MGFRIASRILSGGEAKIVDFGTQGFWRHPAHQC